MRRQRLLRIHFSGEQLELLCELVPTVATVDRHENAVCENFQFVRDQTTKPSLNVNLVNGVRTDEPQLGALASTPSRREPGCRAAVVHRCARVYLTKLRYEARASMVSGGQFDCDPRHGKLRSHMIALAPLLELLFQI